MKLRETGIEEVQEGAGNYCPQHLCLEQLRLLGNRVYGVL